jgi:hypothetical protein
VPRLRNHRAVKVMRVSVKGGCTEGSRMIKAQFGIFLTSKWPYASGKPIRKGGRLRPPTFPDGFPGGRTPFRRQKSGKLGFYHSAPFGAAPFYGYPNYFDLSWCIERSSLTFDRLVPDVAIATHVDPPDTPRSAGSTIACHSSSTTASTWILFHPSRI